MTAFHNSYQGYIFLDGNKKKDCPWEEKKGMGRAVKIEVNLNIMLPLPILDNSSNDNPDHFL